MSHGMSDEDAVLIVLLKNTQFKANLQARASAVFCVFSTCNGTQNASA